MKKLPDVKMGHLEGKNLTFSSDSEEPVNNPNFVSTSSLTKTLICYFISVGKPVAYDQGRRNN